MRNLLITVLLTAVCFTHGHAQLPSPPFLRSWTCQTGSQTQFIAHRNGALYYRSETGLGSIEAGTGKPSWKCLNGQWISDAKLYGSTIYACARGERSSTCWAVNADSGKPTRLVTVAGDFAHLAVDSRCVYISDGPNGVRAIDRSTGKTKWTRKLPGRSNSRWGIGQLAVTTAGLFVGGDLLGVGGLNKDTGTVLWARKAEYGGLYPPVVVDGDVITRHDVVERINLRTGKTVWRSRRGESDPILLPPYILVNDQISLIARNLRTGQIKWKIPLKDKNASYGGSENEPAVRDTKSAWINRHPVFSVSTSGKILWTHVEPFTGSAIYADNQIVVTNDHDRLLGYVRGSLPQIPSSVSEKRVLADRIASRFEELDNSERKQLERLIPCAFTPLLNKYVQLAQRYQLRERNSESQNLYGLLSDMHPLLMATCQKVDTKALVAAWKTLGEKSSWRNELVQLMKAKGDPEVYVPVLVERARSQMAGSPGQRADIDIGVISSSFHPDAVALMLEIIRNPKASSDHRQAAFAHLAWTGGADGVEAVRAARPKRQPGKPWWEHVKPGPRGSRRGHNLPTKAKDGQGETWTLFQSSALGNWSDLYIVKTSSEGTSAPLFTGLFTERTWHLQPPRAFKGVSLSKLIASEWIRLLTSDAELTKDTDSDGLTDLVENRLDTDPTKPDTDGDGESDLTDLCPNAAPRPLGDVEKIVVACIEARFFEQNWQVPAVLSVPGVEPFEVYGYQGLVVWGGKNNRSNLGNMYGTGMNTIGFHSPDERMRDEKEFILFNAKEGTARTIIRRYSGGLNGDGIEMVLRKFGDEWFVVDMIHRYVS